MKVLKSEVTEMMEKLMLEHTKQQWNRDANVLLEAADLMNRMFAYGVNKSNVVKE